MEICLLIKTPPERSLLLGSWVYVYNVHRIIIDEVIRLYGLSGRPYNFNRFKIKPTGFARNPK